MSMQNVKRWQWILMSLIIGAGFGYIAHLPTADWRSAFGNTISQQEFEEGLVREQSGLKWFRNVVVYPESIEDGNKQLKLLIVSGEYFDGRLQDQNGTRVAVWNPRCFIAEGAYMPITPNARSKDTGTVIDYLRSVKGASFAYAWWRDPAWAIGLWTAGSFVVIGLIWPTLINLIAFGSLSRPKDEKGIDLSKVSLGTSRPVSPKEIDLEAAAKMAAELEGKLGVDVTVPPAQQKVEKEKPATPVLTAGALESTMSEQERLAKEFGKERDDFYPTERHAHPKGDPKKEGGNP
jgi:hypothetical protein